MCIAGLLDRKIPFCRPSENLREAARRMWLHSCDSLPVCDENRTLLGLITSRGICAHACTTGRRLGELSVNGAIMPDVVTLGLGQSDGEALALMAREKLWQLPVIDAAGCLVGAVRYERLSQSSAHRRDRIVLVDEPDEIEDLEDAGELGGWVYVMGLRELVSPDGENVPLSRGEARLLRVLSENAGKTISRDVLMQGVCNRPYCPGDRYIDVLVSNLRRKFTALGADVVVIRTIHNGGYAFNLGVADRRHAAIPA